jgi:hypothetical protein
VCVILRVADCVFGDEIESLAAQKGEDAKRSIPVSTIDDIYKNTGELANEAVLDILMIDTEGNDWAALQGAQQTIQRSRIVFFEYHHWGLWEKTSLGTVTSWLFDNFRFYCYFYSEFLWPLSGRCWHSGFDMHDWSNVVCVRAGDIWSFELAARAVKWQTVPLVE